MLYLFRSINIKATVMYIKTVCFQEIDDTKDQNIIVKWDKPCNDFKGYRLSPCDDCGWPYDDHRW